MYAVFDKGLWAVKLSLFTHADSSPLSLAAGYIDVMQTVLVTLNNTWMFSRQTVCVCVYVCVLEDPMPNKVKCFFQFENSPAHILPHRFSGTKVLKLCFSEFYLVF